MTKKNKKYLFGALVALLLLATFLILLGLRSCSSQESDVRRYLEMTYSNSLSDSGPEQRSEDEILADLNEQVHASMITMSMNPDPVFHSSTAKGSVLIHNDDSNNYPQVIQIVRNDTKETVYTSAVIPVGKYLNSDTLDVALEAGDYPCTAYFNSVDEATGEILGTGAVRITVHVEQ